MPPRSAPPALPLFGRRYHTPSSESNMSLLDRPSSAATNTEFGKGSPFTRLPVERV